MNITEKISRKERRAIQKLGHSPHYKWFLWILVILFSPAKKFISLPFKAASKACGIISLTVYKFFWFKIWYIDDFIVHKKLRGKWYWKKLFDSTQEEALKAHCDYVLLFSKKERKASHRFYKKAGLTIIGLWVGILAYKKITHKK